MISEEILFEISRKCVQARNRGNRYATKDDFLTAILFCDQFDRCWKVVSSNLAEREVPVLLRGVVMDGVLLTVLCSASVEKPNIGA